MKDHASPLVSVALPVYNGERYVEETIVSILNQTVRDFELIIVDNASTDRTGEICRRYANADSRVRYLRNASNIGALPNFNLAFRHSTGHYFKWACHDDVLAPEFLEKCIAALRDNPGAVLSYPYTRYIDRDSNPIGYYEGALKDTMSHKPHERFAGVILPGHPAHELLGVYVREVLENSVLYPSYHNGHRELLAENALRGQIVIVPELLSYIRDHEERYSHVNTELANHAEFLDPSRIHEISFPWWRLYRMYWRLVRNNVRVRADRLRCYAQLVRWLWCNWHGVRLAVDVIRIVSPRLAIFAERLKQQYISPEPGMGEARRRQAALTYRANTVRNADHAPVRSTETSTR